VNALITAALMLTRVAIRNSACHSRPVALLLLLAFALSAQDKPPEGCTVSGTVVDSITGEALNKVEAALEPVARSNGPRLYTTTDDKGRFTLTEVPAGAYHLSAKRNGYLETAYLARRSNPEGAIVRLEAGQTLAELKLKLEPYAVISGTVRDSDGEPLAEVRVRLARVSYEYGRRRLEGYDSTNTDDLGNYRIHDLPPGRYDVSASPPEQYRGVDSGPRAALQDVVATSYPGVADPAMAAPVEVRTGERVAGIDITLVRVRTFAVAGRVIGPDGAGVGGATLKLRPLDIHTDVRNPRGEFEFRGVPAGTYMLMAHWRDQMGSVPVQVGNAVEGVKVEIGAGGTVRIRVKPDSAPVQVLLTQDGRNGYRLGADGKSMLGLPAPAIVPDHYAVEVENVPRGLYVKSARVGDADLLADGLTVVAGGTQDIEVALAEDGGSVRGSVAAESVGTVLLAPRRRARGLYRTAATDEHGRYEFESVAPGEYKLFALEDVEPGVWFDADFLREREEHGVAVTVRPKQTESVNLRL
jgi:protocatechuate 3,4-dioxygenase beta subunit